MPRVFLNSKVSNEDVSSCKMLAGPNAAWLAALLVAIRVAALVRVFFNYMVSNEDVLYFL